MEIRCIYKSHCGKANASDWQAILASARRYNSNHGITGALFCDGVHYLQVLEGESHAVDSLFLRINDDPRHDQVELLSREALSKRLFADWSMAFVNLARFAQEFAELDLATDDITERVSQLLAAMQKDKRVLTQVSSIF